MADINTSTWSETAGSNNATPPDGWPENMAYSAVNDAAREMMAAVKREWNRTHPTVTSAGTANAQTLTYTTAPAYSTGIRFNFIAGATNTGAVTLNVNGLGAKNIVRGNGSTALAGGEIQSGALVSVVYDGTSFRMDAPTGWELISKAAPSTAATVDITLPSGYTEYEITYALTTSADAQLTLRSSADGITFDAGGSDYQSAYIFNSGASSTNVGSGAGTSVILTAVAETASVMRGAFRFQASAGLVLYGATSVVFNSGGTAWEQGTAGGARNSATPPAAIRLLASSGTLTGSVSLRGFR